MRTSSVCCFSRSVPSAGGSRTTRANSSTAAGLPVSPSAVSAWQRMTVEVSGEKALALEKAKGKVQKAIGKRHEARGAVLSLAPFSLFHCPFSLVKHQEPPNALIGPGRHRPPTLRASTPDANVLSLGENEPISLPFWRREAYNLCPVHLQDQFVTVFALMLGSERGEGKMKRTWCPCRDGSCRNKRDPWLT